MRIPRRSAAGLAAITMLLPGVGCDDGKPPVSGSLQEVAVTGKVTVEGKPVGGGQILFDPSNIRRKDAMPRSAAIGPDGTFSVSTLVGENMVSVTGKGVPANNQLIQVESGGAPLAIDVAP